MSEISSIDFIKFCVSQSLEFVLVDEDNKVINKDNIEDWNPKVSE